MTGFDVPHEPQAAEIPADGAPSAGKLRVQSSRGACVYRDALARVLRLHAEARARGDPDADLGALATATSDGAPSVRTVWIVRISEAGLAFFADSETGKGCQLQQNPRAAICLHWQLVQHQVIVEGPVTCLPAPESDALWRNVPRDYSLAHWASKQNAEAVNPDSLRVSAREFRRRFSAARVPRPTQWRAFELRPTRIDLWHAGWQHLRPHWHYVRRADGEWISSKRNP